MSESLIGVLNSLWSHISKRRRRQFVFLLLLAVLTSFAEVISLGAVLPFISVLTQPDKVLAYPFIFEFAHKILENRGVVFVRLIGTRTVLVT
mgnify:CR=1 FL=1